MVWNILYMLSSMLLGGLAVRSLLRNPNQVWTFKMIDVIVLAIAAIVFFISIVMMIRGES